MRVIHRPGYNLDTTAKNSGQWADKEADTLFKLSSFLREMHIEHNYSMEINAEDHAVIAITYKRKQLNSIIKEFSKRRLIDV